MKDILSESLLADSEHVGSLLQESHQYWLRRRGLFNVLVGLTGLGCLFLSQVWLTGFFFLLFGVVLWGVVANGLYSFGYVVESYLITNTSRAKGFGKGFREFLFWCGTLAYMGASLLVSLPMLFWAS